MGSHGRPAATYPTAVNWDAPANTTRLIAIASTRSEAGTSRREAVDEREPDDREGDPGPVEQQPPAGGAEVDAGLGSGRQRRKVFPQVPSHTTYTACFSRA